MLQALLVSPSFGVAFASSIVSGSCLGPQNTKISSHWFSPKRKGRKSLCSRLTLLPRFTVQRCHTKNCLTKGIRSCGAGMRCRDGNDTQGEKAGTSSAGLGATRNGHVMTPQPPLLLKGTKQHWNSNTPLHKEGVSAHCLQTSPGRNFQVTSVAKGSVFLSCFSNSGTHPLSLYMNFLWTAASFLQCSHRLEIICLGSLMIIFFWVCESHRVVSVPWLNECNS